MEEKSSNMAMYAVGVLLVVAVVGAILFASLGGSDESDSDSAGTTASQDFESADTVDSEDVMVKEDDAMEKDGEGDHSDDAMAKGDDAMVKEDDAIVKSSGFFDDYDQELLSNADSGDVVLAFLADWCPSCRALESNIDDNLSSIPDDLTIIRVDYDDADDLRKKYNVTFQHTLVQVDADGIELQKWSGGNTLQSLQERVI